MRKIEAVWPKKLRYPNGWLVVLRIPQHEALRLRIGEIVQSTRPDGVTWALRVLQLGELDGSDYHPTDGGLWLWNGEWRLDPANHPKLPRHSLAMFRRVQLEADGEPVEIELSLWEQEPSRDWRNTVDRIK